MGPKNKSYPKKINHLLFTSMLCIGTSLVARAQSDSSATEPKWVIDFGGAIGLYLPYHHADGAKTPIGFTSMTSIQLNYKRHFFTRLEVGDLSVDFKYKSALPTVNSDVNSTTTTINVGLGGGYRFNYRKWQPFVYAGAGPSYVTVPFTEYRAGSNTVRYSTNSSIKLNMNAGAGVNYFLSKSIILLLEARTFSVLNLPQNHSVDLNGISLLVNIKITL